MKCADLCSISGRVGGPSSASGAEPGRGGEGKGREERGGERRGGGCSCAALAGASQGRGFLLCVPKARPIPQPPTCNGTRLSSVDLRKLPC